ncbi:MAG: hypothetical protein QXZ70_07240 [Candidatus Bathyarchaeia archaeon]
MKVKKSYSKEDILRLLQKVERELGRPPKTNDHGLESLVQAARKEFGSWEHALRIAGLQSYKSWRKKRSFASQIIRILNYNPMTLKELKQEFSRNFNSNRISETELSARIITTIKQNATIKTIGPRRSRIYFIAGQEQLARTRLDNIFSTLSEQQEILFYNLRKPMTKDEIKKLFPGQEHKCEKWLRELIISDLIYKAKFVAKAKGSQKYNAHSLFGKLACKIYYCRFDCSEEIADFIIQNIPIEKINETGFRTSLTHRLKSILPPEAFKALERKLFFVINKNTKWKDSKLDYFLQ